jgi:hypothetical protein
MMAVYTVIGFYEEENQAFAEHVVASNEFRAMTTVGNNHAHTDLVIVGAIAGGHDLFVPDEDNGKIAYAVDLADA